MKKLFFLCFILCATIIYAQDFRNVSWGMTKEEVIKNESADAKDSDRDDVLYYSVIIDEYNLNLQYLFTANQLYCATYFRGFENDNYAESYNIQKRFFMKMTDLLNLKYGKGELVNKDEDLFAYYDPSQNIMRKYVNEDIDSFIDINETLNSIQYKQMRKNLFSIGYVYCIKYNTESTVILLLVNQKNSDINQEILYISKKSYNQMNKNIRDALIKNSGL